MEIEAGDVVILDETGTVTGADWYPVLHVLTGNRESELIFNAETVSSHCGDQRQHHYFLPARRLVAVSAAIMLP